MPRVDPLDPALDALDRDALEPARAARHTLALEPVRALGAFGPLERVKPRIAIGRSAIPAHPGGHAATAWLLRCQRVTADS